jgi:hypothetical protein
VTPTEDDVLAVLSSQPRKVGDLGLLLVGATDAGGEPIGAFLAARGLSLSAVQKVVDGLVSDGRARELRGRELWDSFQDGLGANAKGRHFVLA